MATPRAWAMWEHCIWSDCRHLPLYIGHTRSSKIQPVTVILSHAILLYPWNAGLTVHQITAVDHAWAKATWSKWSHSNSGICIVCIPNVWWDLDIIGGIHVIHQWFQHVSTKLEDPEDPGSNSYPGGQLLEMIQWDQMSPTFLLTMGCDSFRTVPDGNRWKGIRLGPCEHSTIFVGDASEITIDTVWTWNLMESHGISISRAWVPGSWAPRWVQKPSTPNYIVLIYIQIYIYNYI